ncbi:MAG: hypothetical protein RB191_21060 [Terriglobia bacterium]|nr:hypothetical protein [Terriglobia bacterium]
MHEVSAERIYAMAGVCKDTVNGKPIGPGFREDQAPRPLQRSLLQYVSVFQEPGDCDFGHLVGASVITMRPYRARKIVTREVSELRQASQYGELIAFGYPAFVRVHGLVEGDGRSTV